MRKILHMDTDQVRSVAGQINQANEDVISELDHLSGAVQSMEWSGPGRESFVARFSRVAQSLSQQAKDGQELGKRLRQESDEWERLAILGDVSGVTRGSITQPGGGGSSEYNNENDWNTLLGGLFIDESLMNQTGFIDWVKGIYDSISFILGKVIAGNAVTQLMEGFGIAWKGIDLADTSQDLLDAQNAWFQAMDDYRPNSPEWLNARLNYSNAELNQVFDGKLKLALQTVGLWDDVVKGFDYAKYQGGL